jgi:hypothetical protein
MIKFESGKTYDVLFLGVRRVQRILNVYSSRDEALSVAKSLAQSNPNAAWEVDL